MAIPVFVAGILVVLAMEDGDGDGGEHDPSLGVRSSTTTTVPPMSPQAQTWQKKVDDAFSPLIERLKELITQSQEWHDDKVTAEAFTADLERIRPEFVRARDQVAAVEPFPEAPAARDVYRESAAMYLEVVRIYGVAAEADAGALKSQLELSARRVRSLADRVYDRGRAMVDPGSQVDPTGTDVEIRRPPEVPDWEAEGLAAGPPLAGEPPAPPDSPPIRDVSRPEQPEAEWLERVGQAQIPTPLQLARTIAGADGTRLRALATRFDDVSDALWAGPDPAGGRERAALLSLSLLVQEEAARLAQAATRLPPGEPATRLTTVARRLALLGERLEDPAVRGETSGLDAGLLVDTGP